MPQWSAPWNAPKQSEQAVIEPTPAVIEVTPVVEAAPAPTQTIEEPVVETPVVEEPAVKKSTKKVESAQAE